jgi:hypothetical protein
MNGFAEALAEDRRLAELKLLLEAGGSANESVLETGLEALGHTTALTRENIRADLKFLEDRALVRLSYFNDKICVAHITRRGVEVAEGRTKVEGIKRPSIGE